MAAAKQAPEELQPLACDRFSHMRTTTLVDWARSAHRRAERLCEQAQLQRRAAARIRAELRSCPSDGGPPALRRLHAAEAEIVNLRRAQVSNRRIGMAVGILMAQHRLTEDKAFDALRMASSHRNVKLFTIAEEVIYTGRLQLDGHEAPNRRRSAGRR